MKLTESRAIVTGGARGMGAYFAAQLVKAGGSVAVGDVQPPDEAALAALNDAGPGRVVSRALDVADADAVANFVAWADDAIGGVNTLINNAGIIRDGLLVKRDRKTGAVVKLPLDSWHQVIDVNLTGATLMVREVAARMLENSPEGNAGGVIINMSSVARHGNRGQSSYVAAKAALAANTVTWARELCRYGIRVGAIAPGMIETPMTQGMNQKARDALVEAVPLRRIGEPDDIWQGVKFILECEYFTARVVDIDGGLVM